MSTENFRYFHPNFRSDFQKKVVFVSFSSGSKLLSANDLLVFRSDWLSMLKMWHSPYKAVIDLTCLDLDYDEDLTKNWINFFKLLKTLFLKEVVAFPKKNKELPFPVYDSELDAMNAIGLRVEKTRSLLDESFRDLILIENRFLQHVVEISFFGDGVVRFDSLEKVSIFKAKLLNNLRLWHSGWSLLIDCHNMTVLSDFWKDFQAMEKFFKGFFLREIIGFSPLGDSSSYPFTVYRSRHAAAGRLENEGNFSGEDPQCRSKKA